MHRPFLFFRDFLASTVSVGQTAPAGSQTSQALLADVGQLRQDLQTTTVAWQRVQILLLSRQTVVAGAQQRLDGAHSKLVEAQSGVRDFISENQRVEATLNDSWNPADRKELEVMLTKAQRDNCKPLDKIFAQSRREPAAIAIR